jgi:N-acyl-phosphatidylethanolamine-hydrolysing phospholipase D
VLPGVLACILTWHLGWLAPREGWGVATGWERIPHSDLPSSGGIGPDKRSAVVRSPDEPEILWLGHAGFLLRWHRQTVLLDPNVNTSCTISKRVLEIPFDLDAVGPVDGVLISHPHFDHLDLPTLRSIGRIGTLVVPSGSEGFVASAGVNTASVVSLGIGDTTNVGPIEVIAVSAAHNGSRMHPLQSKRLAVGYILRSGGVTLYYSGDTGFSNSFEKIRDEYHPQVAILPIGAYLPRIPMKYFHLSPEEAIDAAVRLRVETVIPCHFGTFTLSLDRPDWALPRFAEAARRRGVEWRMPELLREGTELGGRVAGSGSS